ncbi:hypothetical protein HOLleu_19654 [Holothuria leucospilota]|uniref:Uncharacterized protein n=1 Tax=Holothuria leucospilota TaxID=206669 RepID=A0A9Q1H7C8_HOLLE|nr:hypothetical protein HOLleu_19654 [Holothuria leucospilota]
MRRQLGFGDQEPAQDPAPRKSKLSLNRQATEKESLLPVDVECLDRFKVAAESKKWSPFPRKQCSDFKLEEKEWKDCFKSPRIPVGAVDHLKNAGAMDPKGKFKSSATKKSNQAFAGIDKAARAGMKFLSALLLVAEVLSKSFRQTGEETVSRKDTGTVVNILGPLSRLIFDQFSCIAVRSVRERRDLVMDALILPSQDIKRRFLELPLSGEDIFGGLFDSHLQTEVKRQKDMKKADFRIPSSFYNRWSPDRKSRQRPRSSSDCPSNPHRSYRPRPTPPSRGGRAPFLSRQLSRGGSRSTSRGRGNFQKP